MINKSPLPPSRRPGEALNSSPSIMTLSAYRSGYDPCTVILISSASAPAITPSHISGASRPLDNLMMQRALPSLPPPLPPSSCSCRALISPCSFRLISAKAALRGFSCLKPHIFFSSPVHLQCSCMGDAVQDCRASVSDLAHSPCRLPRSLRHPSLDSVPFLPLSQSDISLSFQPSPLSLGVIVGDIWRHISREAF